VALLVEEASARVAAIAEAEALLGHLLGEALAVCRHAPLRRRHLRLVEADAAEHLIRRQCDAVQNGEVATAADGDVLVLLVRIECGAAELRVQDTFVGIAAAIGVSLFKGVWFERWH